MNTQIDTEILLSHGAISKTYAKGEVIFFEEDEAKYYYQITSGEVKMVSISEDGKEFIQGFFKEGNSFGEPPLFVNQPYPSTAIAAKETSVLKLSKENFLQLLSKHPEIERAFLYTFAQRIYNKTKVSNTVINNTPEHRILGFLHLLKASNNTLHGRTIVPYTRQELANFVGLRVETVIRTLSKMKNEKKLDIIDHKLYF
jgi:CRP-like cAMP-binding protein